MNPSLTLIGQIPGGMNPSSPFSGQIPSSTPGPSFGMNILFYSNFCQLSKVLVQMLTTENLLPLFKSICTYNNQMIPPNITITPTMIISKCPKPYIAGECFEWIQKIKIWRHNMMMQRLNGVNQQFMQAMGINLGGNESILGFSSAEMDGMSDIFAYLASDDAIPHSYNYLGKEAPIFTAPQQKIKLDDRSQKKFYDDMMKKRVDQDNLQKKQYEYIKKNAENMIRKK